MAIIGISGKIGSGKDTVGSIIQYLTTQVHIGSTLKEPRSIGKHLSFQEFQSNFVCFGQIDTNWEIKKFAGKLKQIVALLTGCTVEDLESQEFKNKQLPAEWDYVNKWLHGDNMVSGNYPKSVETYKDDEIFKGNPKRFTHHYTYRDLLQKIGTNAMRDMIHENVWVNSLMADYKPNLTFTEEENKRLLSIWKNMNTRCTNPNYEKYHKYGGRGITICKEWKDFNVFKIWSLSNGYTNELTLDRRNTDGNYEPNNCRYVTTSLQAFNKNSYDNKTSSFKGISISFNDSNKWQAQIQSKGVKENLGDYNTQEEAKLVYDKRYKEILDILEYESKCLQRNNYPNWLITDMRFENELNAVKDKNGITIRVSRGVMKAEDVKNQQLSETALDEYKLDYFIKNDGTIEELVEKVKEILIKEKII